MPHNISRRDLAKGALAGSVLMQVKAQDSAKMDDRSLDPVYWSAHTRYQEAPLKMGFRAQTRKEAEAWQKGLRAKVIELLGGFPQASSAPKSETIETRTFPGYRREKFSFESRPGVQVVGYLLTPTNSKGPYATVICVPGHGRGADDIVGIDEKGNDRTDKAGYQHDFAIQAAELGMAAVAIEPMAFGCRRDAITAKKGSGASACQPSAGAALLLGETMIGWRVYDVMRTVDWIGTRKELAGNRIGCMGISGGGTCTLFSAALDPRIKAAFVSGYLNTFRDSIMSLSHCIDNYVPGILQWAEQYDVAGLIAPRPLFAESGSRDPIFPIAGSKASFARVKAVYEVFDATDRIGHEVFDGVHTFHGVQGLPFLAKHLSV